MKDYFADLHIHIGWTEKKEPVKITGSKNLTFYHILHEANYRKGLHMIGIIDAHSPIVQNEILDYMKKGIIKEQKDGGLKYNNLTVLLGAEIEIKEGKRGAAHFLCFFPFLEDIMDFTSWLKMHMKNVNLSSQRLYVSAKELQYQVKKRSGIFIPAHIFTPFKSLFGSCCDSISDILDVSLVDGVELGLSSDSYMADRIEDLHSLTFLSNSDAHSLKKIAREYNRIRMIEPSFKEFRYALNHTLGRQIMANYGLDPKLGKYYQSRCLICDEIIEKDSCMVCKGTKIVKGVSNRINEIASYEEYHLESRPPYIHQVPLEFLPNIGPKTLDKLIDYFDSEMNIIHHVTREELLKVVPEKIASLIILARQGKLMLEKGGGGIYGKVLK